MTQTSTTQMLPRLLYISDVPVESTLAGSALIYRLLQNYPTSHLQIIEGNIWISDPAKRLPNVQYDRVYIYSKRLLHSRLNSVYSFYILLSQSYHIAQFEKLAKKIKPEAILAVAHGFSWLMAASLAKRLGIPLHLIIHDDWPSFISLPLRFQYMAHDKFGAVYHQAKSRLCVSPYMAEEYEMRYGAPGSVLYPSRAADSPIYDQPVVREKQLGEPFIFAYAGSINSKQYADCLATFASLLKQMNSQLVIYSSASNESMQRWGIIQENVTIYPTIPYHELMHQLRTNADALFIPMSFDPADKISMQINFPSKLTDYTAIGLPLLIYGPSYGSAIQWAYSNPGVAEVVDNNDIQMLKQAIKKLSTDREYRYYLASNAMQKGIEYFSHSAATKKLYDIIINGYETKLVHL